MTHLSYGIRASCHQALCWHLMNPYDAYDAYDPMMPMMPRRPMRPMRPMIPTSYPQSHHRHPFTIVSSVTINLALWGLESQSVCQLAPLSP